MKGFPELRDIAAIEEELKERGLKISIIARIYRKQNGEELYMSLEMVQPPDSFQYRNSRQRKFRYMTVKVDESHFDITNHDAEKSRSA